MMHTKILFKINKLFPPLPISLPPDHLPPPHSLPSNLCWKSRNEVRPDEYGDKLILSETDYVWLEIRYSDPYSHSFIR